MTELCCMRLCVSLSSAAALLLALSGCDSKVPEKPPPGPATYAPAKFEIEEATKPPKVMFTDVTKESGISFTHETGAFGKKYLPETMGSGACVFDADGDHKLDLLFVQSAPWPGQGDEVGTMKLYRSLGGLKFADVTAESGLGVPTYGMGAAAADYDGDGDEDVYVTTIRGNLLFANDGKGKFADVTQRACVGGDTWKDKRGQVNHPWSTSAAWLDYDKDGLLDLFVCNYVRWSIAEDITTTLTGLDKAYTIPTAYQGQSCVLYRNRGDGTFEDVSQAAGVQNPAGKSLGVAVWDINDDGALDIAVANDTQPNYLYLNSGDGHFKDIAMQAGIAYDDTGRARAGMGIDIADYKNDGKPAIAIGNFSGEPVSFYRQTNGTFFLDSAGSARLSTPTLQNLKFGLIFFDYDLDGALDLMTANGHIEPDINKVQHEITYRQPVQLFWNTSTSGFVEVTDIPALKEPVVGRGLACGDLDGDGDLDVVLSNNGGPCKVLRNDLETDGRHWVRIDLDMPSSKNQRALGARVTLKSGDLTQVRMSRTGSSYLSQSELTLTFGLGERTKVDQLEVRWPNGKTEQFAIAAVDKTYTLTEGSGK